MILYDDVEVAKIRGEARRQGYNDAAKLVDDILKGQRNLRIGLGQDKHGLQKSESIYNYPDNVFCRLVKILDEKSPTPEGEKGEHEP